MFCENCGKENLDDARVCAHCGKELQAVKKDAEGQPVKGQTLLKVLLIVSFCLTCFFMSVSTLNSGLNLITGGAVSGMSMMLSLFLTWPLAIVVFALGVGRKVNKSLEILSIINFLFTIAGPILLNYSVL